MQAIAVKFPRLPDREVVLGEVGTLCDPKKTGFEQGQYPAPRPASGALSVAPAPQRLLP